MLSHIWVCAQQHRGGDDRPLRLALELARGTGACPKVCHVVGASDDEPVAALDVVAREFVGAGLGARRCATIRALAMRCAAPGAAEIAAVSRAIQKAQRGPRIAAALAGPRACRDVADEGRADG